MSSESQEHPLILKFRNECLSRGAAGIKGISRLWSTMDDDGSRSLNLDEFVRNVKNHNIKFTKDQTVELFKVLDTNNSGSIDFDEFLAKLRPPMSQSRINLVHLAFDKLDKSKDKKITVDDLIGVYNVKKNPKYLNGEMTEEQCLAKFLDNFEVSQHKDGIVTFEEFLLYYAGVSASIDSDVYFDFMMRNSWKL